MQKTVFFIRGLPGTGKTTLCSTIRTYGRHLKIAHISRDIIREKLRKERGMKQWDYNDENESFVSNQFRTELVDVLVNPKNDWILIDNTNLSFNRAIELEQCMQEANAVIDTVISFKVVILQLGGWMSKMRQHPQITKECEEKMRKEMGDSGLEYFKHCEITPNWWFYMCKSWSDVTLCSGCVPFDWKWKVPMIGGWTKATTDILCNFFDPTLSHDSAEFGGIFFMSFAKVFSTYFSEDFKLKE